MIVRENVVISFYFRFYNEIKVRNIVLLTQFTEDF